MVKFCNNCLKCLLDIVKLLQWYGFSYISQLDLTSLVFITVTIVCLLVFLGATVTLSSIAVSLFSTSISAAKDGMGILQMVSLGCGLLEESR